MMTRYSTKKKFLLIMLLSAFPLLLFSQSATTCAENLKSAQAFFDKGQIEQIPGMLRECMKSGFKREEQIAAYKLLIQSFLFEDKLAQADSAMLAFLKKYPEYQLSPTDHSSFVNLFNSFNVKKIIQFSVHLGTNIPYLTYVNVATHSSSPGLNKYSINALNLFGSVETKYSIGPRLEINAEGAFSRLSFTNTEDFLNSYKIKYTEIQNRIEIPVTATYNFARFGIFTMYGRAGLGAALNLATSARVMDVPTDQNNFDIITGADINRNNSRIFLDLFAQAGTGIKVKIPRGYFSLEARSNFGFFNQVVRGAGLTAEEEELDWKYKFIDDDFRLNNLNISIGVSQIFFKPSKRK